MTPRRADIDERVRVGQALACDQHLHPTQTSFPAHGTLRDVLVRHALHKRPSRLDAGRTSRYFLACAATAVRASGARAVDVSSGVERAPGVKAPELIRRLLGKDSMGRQRSADAESYRVPRNARSASHMTRQY